MKMAYIYILIDPITGFVRYVGKTNYPDTRLKYHLKDVKCKRFKNQHKKAWINKLLDNELKPIFEIIDIVNNDEWEFWERHYISLYYSWGFNLVNKTSGGEGASCGISLNEEHRKKISVSNKGRVSNRKGIKMSKDQKNKISMSLKNAYLIGKKKPVKHTDLTKKIISEKKKEIFRNGRQSTCGEKNGMYGRTKEVCADGMIFKSKDECAKFYNVHVNTIKYRIKSKNFPTYFFMESHHANVRLDKEDLSPAFPFKDFALRLRD